jgi:hypothetical protein
MVGLIKFAVIFFLFYFLFSLFSRYILPFIVRLLFQRMSNRVRGDYDKKMREQRKKKREGEVIIRYKPGEDNKIITKEDGEYVDYEELDDD